MGDIYTVQVTEKGQIVLPADLRRKYGVVKGTVIEIEDNDGVIRLRPDTVEYVRLHVQKTRGMFGGPGAVDELMRERAAEREREERKIEHWKHAGETSRLR